jgi:hypothetical protein
VRISLPDLFSAIVLKNLKTILLRFLFYVIAFQILNQSIDLDHLGIYNSISLADYDDIDSITELIIETITGDDHYTSEQDDDNGNDQDKGADKCISFPLFFEPIAIISLPADVKQAANRPVFIIRSTKTCKGYFSIFSPPPDVV